MAEDHPRRQEMVNELHARPFPTLRAPCRAVYLALLPPADAAQRDRAGDIAQLRALVAAQGGQSPADGAGHFTTQMGRAVLKWESHTEFVTYAAFTDGPSARAFDPADAEVFPAAWQEAAPGRRIAAVQVRVEPLPEDGEAGVVARLEEWLSPDSLAVSWALGGDAAVASDFRLDPAGFMRVAVFVREGVGERRVGRIVHQLVEIEIYRAMAMLGLARARELTATLNALDPRLSALVASMSADGQGAEETLHDLLGISAELEALAARHSFRFGATWAYEAIVAQRIEALREDRFRGRQTIGEFMQRRFDPAMRTAHSADRRIEQMAGRAARAAELLRTRVDVERSAQNQALLASMDRRADLQLRLQHTVEGLSVVAISYYAVSLLGYLLAPAAKAAGGEKTLLLSALAAAVFAGVWLMVRAIRKRMR